MPACTRSSLEVSLTHTNFTVPAFHGALCGALCPALIKPPHVLLSGFYFARSIRVKRSSTRFYARCRAGRRLPDGEFFAAKVGTLRKTSASNQIHAAITVKTAPHRVNAFAVRLYFCKGARRSAYGTPPLPPLRPPHLRCGRRPPSSPSLGKEKASAASLRGNRRPATRHRA
jgi:hypothetical protein